jgi:hypothetical protein
MKSFQMHWAVVVRGITYELVRMEDSRKVELRVTPPGSCSAVNALGIPLKLAWVEELGITYLPNQRIHSLGELQFDEKFHSKIPDLVSASKAVYRNKNYNALTHNCQFIWTDELLPKMVCQCQDQILLDVPSEVLDWSLRKILLVTISLLIASALTSLRGARIFPCQIKLCSKTNAFGIICSEVSKYFVLFRTFFGDNFCWAFPRSSNRRLPIPLMDVPGLERMLERAKTGEAHMDSHIVHFITKIRSRQLEHETMKLFTNFSEQIYALERFYTLGVPLSTIFSCLHRVYSYPGFQFLEAIFAFVAVLKMYKALQLVDLPGFPPLRKCTMREEMACSEAL